MSLNFQGTDRRLVFFEGAVEMRVMAQLRRAFSVEVTFAMEHPRMLAWAAKKLPLHFHPYQEEYFQVLEGSLGVEVEGKTLLLTPDSGEFCVPCWHSHRIFPPISKDDAEGSSSTSKITKVLVSGQQTSDVFKMDMLFFENWYAYQDKLVAAGKLPNIIQLMCMWDAGDSYFTFPWWVPFGKRLSQILGVVVGRWIGGILGYQPYHREWTTDWETACERMASSWLWRNERSVKPRTG